MVLCACCLYLCANTDELPEQGLCEFIIYVKQSKTIIFILRVLM
jgi:hypothetical protein